MPFFKIGERELGDNHARKVAQAVAVQMVEQVVKVVDVAHADKHIGAMARRRDVREGVV